MRGPRRRRFVNRDTWRQLKEAEKKVGLGRPEILRLCLTRLFKQSKDEGQI